MLIDLHPTHPDFGKLFFTQGRLISDRVTFEMFLGEQTQGRFRPLKSVQIRVLGPTLRSSEAPGSTREILRVSYRVRAPTTRFRPVISLTVTA